MSESKRKNFQAKQKTPIRGKPLVKKEKSTGFYKWAPIAILIFTALVYSKAINNGFVGWDDNDYIIRNTFIRDFSLHGVQTIFSSFYMSNYHPFTTLVFMLEFKFFGLNPMPYHALNVLLHILNTWLVFKFIEQLSRKKITAIIVALLFAIHPMHVESVVWVSELKDMLYTSFYLLALLAYLKYLRYNNSKKYYMGSLLLFVCSLFSKSAAVTLPVLLIVIDVYKGRKINFKLLLEKVPFLLLSIVFGILAILSQKVIGIDNDINLSHRFIDRIFIFTYTVSFYIVKGVFPFGLSAMHYPEMSINGLPWIYYASLLFLLIIAWIVIRRSSLRKELLFGVFFFLVAISVMLQIVQVGNAIASERYTYVSYIGLFFIVGQWFSSIEKKKLRNMVVAVFSFYLILFTVQTSSRISVWKDGDVLFTDVINKYPNVFLAHFLRGKIRKENGDLQGALQDYNKSLELKPNYVVGLTERADLLAKLGDNDGAMKDINYAIKLDPTIAVAYSNRGSIYQGMGNTKLALNDYNKAIILNPLLAEAYNNRAILKLNTNDRIGSLKDIRSAIALNPNEASLYSSSGYIKFVLKDYKGAVDDITYSLKLKPNDITNFYLRGNVKLNMKDTSGACEDWNQSMALGSSKEALEAISKYCHKDRRLSIPLSVPLNHE